MVFFSCDGCGDMLKKNQVDGHARRCRQCESVSCVDCSVSFYGEDYRTHTSCFTEAEKYEKTVHHKKRTPQEAWMDLIGSCAAEAPEHLRHYLQDMSTMGNVPRKEKQFRNYTANSLNLKRSNNMQVVDALWKFLSSKRDELKKKEEEQQSKTTSKSETSPPKESKDEDASKNQDTGDAVSKNEDLENKNGETNTEKDSTKDKETTEPNGKNSGWSKSDSKSVKKSVKRTLKKAPERRMKLKALCRAVSEHLGMEKSERKKLKEMILDNGDQLKVVLEGKIVRLK